MKFIKWISTLVEDKAGSISSKRVGFFWCLWMLSRAVNQPVVNEVVIWGIVGLAFGLVGLTIPEWFSELKKQRP
ncbi:hypothetical protein [uncultured Draconibacterium sp.]|uniref:hypothetical protein n=1 Tax=uncultured Draconibacterium sp. TaxID=1573823 RepID=UPI0032163570